VNDQPQSFKWIGTRSVRPDGVDKVTGRATFGADHAMPGMLVGRILRSPHAHARIRSINTDRAMALAGVKAVATAADFPEIPSEAAGSGGEGGEDFRQMSDNVMARNKALYDGHAVAAVAATSAAIAEQALGLIDVDYEVLAHVIEIGEAMADDAPLLHEGLITKGVDPKPSKASNVAKRFEFALGDLDAGFAAADVVIEKDFTTQQVHQGYIEPHAAIASAGGDGQALIWCSSQGQFMVRAYSAKLLGMDIADIRVIPAEIGGGFGGKTTVYLEPVALMLSKKAGRPVKITMTRDEVFRGTGPTSASEMRVKIGATKDGRITAADATFHYQAGAYPGSPVQLGCMTAFAPYDLENVRTVGYDVLVNRPKAAAYRAPGAPMASFAAESVIDMMAEELGIDPVAFRMMNAAKEGTKAAYGPKFRAIGYEETLQAVIDHPHYQAPLGENQGRGVASGFWFNIGGQSAAAVNINEDGTAVVISGTPDIGGSRASLALMAAEVLGIDVERIRPIIADTSAIGYNDMTGGSRVTFSIGMAVHQAAGAVVEQLRQRAAALWDIPLEDVTWQDGQAVAAGEKAAEHEPLSLAAIAAKAGKTGGPITGNASINAQGAGPGFGTHVCDVEVDPDTGRVTVLRYTVVQDAGRAIHPSYVEGQMQGGAAQGVGWALNEEYIYNDQGQLENPGFLDYRMPVASDLPMIDTVIVEVPNPRHPFGVRGVGEVPIIPPLAAVANAVKNAVGLRMTDLPISPPRLLAALEENG